MDIDTFLGKCKDLNLKIVSVYDVTGFGWIRQDVSGLCPICAVILKMGHNTDLVCNYGAGSLAMSTLNMTKEDSRDIIRAADDCCTTDTQRAIREKLLSLCQVNTH